MDKIHEFLKSHNIAVFSTNLPDGSIHAASLHFSHAENPLELYFSTDRESRKCQGLLHGEILPAAVVVGFSTEEWVTLQLDGEVQAVLVPEELRKIQDVHYAKHPHSEKYKDDPATIFLKFTPKWWRYTDFNTEPVMIVAS